jgi:alkaline phosphatase D
MLLHRRLSFGRLAQFHVLDSRQFRSPQACGGGRVPRCDEMDREDRTMLGAAQERWLEEGLVAGSATWNVLAQQVLMAPMDVDPGPGESYNMDTWNGYPAARRRLTQFLAARRVPDVVTLTGDVHASYAAEIPADHRQAGSPAVAVEYVATSLSSGGDGIDQLPQIVRVLPANPWLKYHNARRGYIRCDVTPDAWHADFRLLKSVQSVDAPIATVASFVTAVGSGRVERV